MSSERRASSVSSAMRDSRRLRSRIRGCEREASAQTVGSAIFSSTTASSRFRRDESKILPQFAYSVAHRGVGIFKVTQHRDLVYVNFVRRLNARPSAVTRAQVQAKISPCAA